MENFEYCIWDNIDNCLHRGPMSRADAETWMDEWREMTIPNNCFSTRRRAIGVWESYA